MRRLRGGRVGVRMRVTVVGVQDSRVVTTSVIPQGIGYRETRDRVSLNLFSFSFSSAFVHPKGRKKNEDEKKKRHYRKRERIALKD